MPVVRVGRFEDARDTDSDWLGAIRGGYGNVLKRLRTEESTHLAVEAAFRNALTESGLYADGDSARFEIDGRILKLDCSYYVNREAHAHLEVQLVDLVTKNAVFSGSYRSDLSERGVGAGIFGSVDTLRELAENALSDAIDQVLSDPSFEGALLPTPADSTGDVAERLRTLESLRDQGLIDRNEFEARRSRILDEL